MRLRSVCLHGPESTGKSTIGPRLAAHFGSPYVAEYGRTYAEEHGTEFTMADLVAIAEGHDDAARAAVAAGPHPPILDTDPLMTIAGRAPPISTCSSTPTCPGSRTAPACSAR